MPRITIHGQVYEVPTGKRLVLAIEDSGIPILHRCGGYARCTTCRVRFFAGEPDKMTEAEKTRLRQDPSGLYGRARLSCQILCESDMVLEPILTLTTADVDNPGKRPEDHITPQVVWTVRD
jgi:ferredoxin